MVVHRETAGSAPATASSGAALQVHRSCARDGVSTSCLYVCPGGGDYSGGMHAVSATRRRSPQSPDMCAGGWNGGARAGPASGRNRHHGMGGIRAFRMRRRGAAR